MTPTVNRGSKLVTDAMSVGSWNFLMPCCIESDKLPEET